MSDPSSQQRLLQRWQQADDEELLYVPDNGGLTVEVGPRSLDQIVHDVQTYLASQGREDAEESQP